MKQSPFNKLNLDKSNISEYSPQKSTLKLDQNMSSTRTAAGTSVDASPRWQFDNKEADID